MLTLDLFIDPTCPWSYLGKTMLDRALVGEGARNVTLAWHPLRFEPGIPAGGLAYTEYLLQRYGNAEAALAAMTPFYEEAAKAGIKTDPSRIARMPQMLDGFRLLHWAGLEGVQTAVMDGMVRAFWESGLDLGDPDVLLSIAAQSGMEPELVARLLDSDADCDEVLARETHARQRGISGTPSFIIDQKHFVAGAQPSAFWEELLQAAAGLDQPDAGEDD